MISSDDVRPPQITAVIPTYRRPQLLRRAVRSVLAQTFRDLIVTVLDNASGDDTEAVVAELAAQDRRVRYVRRPQNIGAFGNFVDGMARVETPFFSILSDDDVLLPRFYERALSLLHRHPAAEMAALSALEFDESGAFGYEPLARWRTQGLFAPPTAMYEMLHNKHPTWTAAVFRTRVLTEEGALDPAVGLPSDLDFELRIAAHQPVVVSFEPGALYVRHASAASAFEDTNVIAGYERMREKFRDDERLNPADRHAMHRLLGHQAADKLVEIAGKAMLRGQYDVADMAVTKLRAGYGRAAQAAALALASRGARRSAWVRTVLSLAEAWRLRRRAATTRASASQLAEYAAMLAPPPVRREASASA